MEGPSRNTGFRQSRRSRSQRDRERRRRRVDLAEERATSLSSGSDREACGTNSVLGPGGRECRPGFGRHRPPRRRKRESVSCEEEIIDGFAIASFISLEALEMDCSLKPSQRTDMLGRRNKGKRGPEENGGGPLSEPEEGAPPSSYWNNSRNKRRKIEGQPLETGYIVIVDPAPSNTGSSVGKSCPSLPVRFGGVSRLMVTPRVSGLERSQEKNLEPHFPEPVSSSTSSPFFPGLPSHSPVTVPRSSPVNGGSRHNSSPPLSKPKPSLPPRTQSIYNSSTPVKPQPSASSVGTSSSSILPPPPSASVSLPFSRGSGSSGPLRPPSRTSSGALFTSSPGLPPPPPLLQGTAHPTEAGRSTPGGPAAPSSTQGSSSRTSQNQTSIPAMAFQFHQHNHQHQHTHTHQHFTPFLTPATASPMFDKYPGKMDGLYRHTIYPTYTPPSVQGIQIPPPPPPPPGHFSSLQGAFQPKGTGPDIQRFGVVPSHLQPKDPRCLFCAAQKPGKWCAMHVQVAYMIHNHQRKVKLMQADPHKLDFRSDPLARFSGAGGLGPMPLPPAHDLTRPPSLFSAAGPVNPPSAPFISPSAPHSSFLAPTPHLDLYGRSPSFTPLGALGSGAFGGLGSPTLAGSVFGPKDSPASVVGGLSTPNHHDPWNRLHGGPPGFSAGPSWAKGADRRDERERVKEGERRDIPHIKDEKDRDMLYGPPVRISPVGPSYKPRSSTPVSHINGHSSTLGGTIGPIEDLTRSLNRDRDRDRDRDVEKRPVLSTSSRGDRPRSSSSSVLTPPPPSNRSAQSPLDLYPRSMASTPHNSHNESSHSQRDGSLPSSSTASSSVSSLSQTKKPDRTSTPQSKPSMQIQVKQERKEEPEHIPISHHPLAPSHSFDRPNSHPHHPSSGTPSSSSLSLTPTPGVPLPPPTPNPPSHQQMSLLERTRTIEAYLGGAVGPGGLVVGPGGERFPHGPPQGPSQGAHSFPWDPWREQQHQHRREALAFRSDHHLALRPEHHLAQLFRHQRLFEAERAAVAAAVVPHPQPSTSNASSAVCPDFSLMAHPFDRHPQLGPPGDYRNLMHLHLPPGSHLSSPSHAATAPHLDQLHPLAHSLPPGASGAHQHHPGFYSRLTPLIPPHMANGILAKTTAGLVGPLQVGAPPPLIPSVTNRSATPPRSSRLAGPGELALYSAHKDAESR
uniref:Fibrosin n=1 Tax=Astatotilapia calliptera TaxID=8154 RepID=A0AAX7UFT9_ASTCA